MYLNTIQIIGFVGEGPERRQVQGKDAAYIVFSVATQRSWKNAPFGAAQDKPGSFGGSAFPGLAAQLKSRSLAALGMTGWSKLRWR